MNNVDDVTKILINLMRANIYSIDFQNRIKNQDCGSLVQVLSDVYKYFEHNLSSYIVIDIKQYEHPGDSYLFKVLAINKANNTFAYWSVWNTCTCCLNHGHYGYDDFDDVIADYDSVGRM